MNEETSAQRKRAGLLLSLLIAVIFMAVMLLAGAFSREAAPYRLGDYSSSNISTLKEAYTQSGTTDDLISLLCALCYRAEVESDQAAAEDIAHYGTQLYDMARREEIDLSNVMGTEELSEELIRLIRKYGAT